MSKQHVMVDLETLSIRPYAAIVSIGAVKFTEQDGILDTFYINVDGQSCKDHGLHIDPKTIEWWSKQSPEARKALTDNPQPLVVALEEFSNFYGEDPTTIIWGNGSAFHVSYTAQKRGLH